ncbi:hypothetical protein B566_EDAN003656, partial [Ephemera danica]
MAQASISSEESDDMAGEGLEELVQNEKFLQACQDSMRQRRSSRAPEEPPGRSGVWGVADVACDLRALNDTLWELTVHGDERRVLEAVRRQKGLEVAALLMAAWHGLTDLTHSLLLKHASPNVSDAKGRTPLHLACCAGADDCVSLLLRAGANVDSWDAAHKVTPLQCAAAAPSVACVRRLLRAGADPNAGMVSNSARSALHLAVQAGSPEIVEMLLDAGASTNTPQPFTETPLHVAAGLGSTACVRLLLERGANVSVRVGPSKTTPLHLAAEDGNADCARMLLDAGAESEAKNARQQTPLHLAALAQSAETLELLLHRGADPNSTDDSGRTPLHSAIVKGSRSCECVRLLVEHNADVNHADTYGYTPLHISALSEFSACCELLIRNGAHVTARTKGGVSALSFMVRRTPDALQRFLDRIDSSISLHEHELGDVDCTLKLDFQILVPRSCHGESELLLTFIEVGQRHLLQHPLCQTFLFLKWKHVRKFFLISLFFHALFVVLHTAYVMEVFLDPGPPTTGPLPVTIQLIGYCLLVMNVILMMAHAKYKYARYWENWLQWIIVLSVFACVETLWTRERRALASWQHHAAAFGMFFTWLELMMLVGRFPIFGLYVQMFTTVARNFAKFLLAYSCLLVAFGLSFAVLFPKYKSFKSVPWSLLKTVVMMIGELEFEAIFFDESTPIVYPVSAHLLFFTFTLLAAVVLMNLLVGLAVSDIQGLQRSAGLDRLVRQAEIVSHIESIVFSKLCGNCIPDYIVRFCHRNALLITSNYRRAFYIRPNDPRESRIPKELVEACYRLVESKSPSKKRKGNFGSLSGIRHVSQYSTSSVHQHVVDPTILEHIRGQLAMLVSQAEQTASSEAGISQRVTNLAIQVEALRKEINTISSKATLTDNYKITFVSEPNIAAAEPRKVET